ncbi:MAG: hypothetical protein O2960_10720 [Verrucomicrobia bacterium]|nr:hypothetical protein [Verrucomicrobiota bacterium]
MERFFLCLGDGQHRILQDLLIHRRQMIVSRDGMRNREPIKRISMEVRKAADKKDGGILDANVVESD